MLYFHSKQYCKVFLKTTYRSPMVPKLWAATHWWIVKHSEVGRKAFVRLVIKTPTAVPQHQFRRKSNACRGEELFFSSQHQFWQTQGRAHLRQSKVGRELKKFGNHCCSLYYTIRDRLHLSLLFLFYFISFFVLCVKFGFYTVFFFFAVL